MLPLFLDQVIRWQEGGKERGNGIMKMMSTRDEDLQVPFTFTKFVKNI